MYSHFFSHTLFDSYVSIFLSHAVPGLLYSSRSSLILFLYFNLIYILITDIFIFHNFSLFFYLILARDFLVPESHAFLTLVFRVPDRVLINFLLCISVFLFSCPSFPSLLDLVAYALFIRTLL